MAGVVERIRAFNRGRNPDFLNLKYKLMRSSIFAFYRGTCHLFYEDWPQNNSLDNAPLVYVCGDLHLENFGSYKGDNRLVYFDVNDFDEAALAPCSWDLTRCVTSIVLAADSLGIGQAEKLVLVKQFLEAYIAALLKGKARMVEGVTAKGLVKDLLVSLETRSRRTFLDERTVLINNARKLRLVDKNLQTVPKAARIKVENIMTEIQEAEGSSTFFKLLDVAYRIAGNSSLGIERYILLVEDESLDNRNYLLDLKSARQSSLLPYLKVPQPHWKSEAERIASIQYRFQGTSPALLKVISSEEQSFVLRELQPTQDKINLALWKGKLSRLEKLMTTLGEVVAWGELRSSGRQGSATADELITFAENAAEWRPLLVEHAYLYGEKVEADYREFCETSQN